MEVKFAKRDFSEIHDLPPVKFRVGPYAHHAVGGPLQAEIEATGDIEDLFTLLNWVRYPVEIYNDAGVVVWWGYIGTVTLAVGNRVYTASIEEMTNRVAVAFTTVGAGTSTTGLRGTTDWASDLKSIEEFGRKELLDSMGGTTQAFAEASRDRTLKRQRYPVARIKAARTAAPYPRVTLDCLGWWSTLEWVYCNVPTLLAFEYTKIGNLKINLGEDHNDDAENVIRLAQSVDTGPAGYNLQEIEIHAARVGMPAEGLTFAIYENPGNAAPGASLGSANIPAAAFETTAGWVRGTLSEPVALEPHTSYFLVVSFNGTPDASNYFRVSLDETQGYAGGILRQYITSWGDAPAADMPFRLYTNNIVENAEQIRSILISHGQFLRRVYIQDTAGIATESFRNGDSDARFEVEELLENGTAGLKRLLARVDPGRNVWIEAEDDVPAHILSIQNRFVYLGAELDNSTCPVGFWCQVEGVGASVDTSQLSGMSAFFVERTEYDPETGEISFDPAGERNPYDFGAQNG